MAGPLISLSGLASGMDTEAVITQLLTLERQPRSRLELKQTTAQARTDALKDVATRLNALKTAAADLRSVVAWGDTQEVTSGDPSRVAVRRLAGAGPGGHTVEVTSLASAAQRTFAFQQQAAASSITIGGATVTLGANATIAEAVSAINSSADAGVYAVDVGGRLVLSARTTGTSSDFTASGAALTEDPLAAKAGANAVFKVDGVDQPPSQTNVVSTAIAGLELTLKAPTSGPVALTVGAPAPDRDAVKAKVKAFVEAYNLAVDTVRTKLEEKRVPNATTAADAKKGVLFGDPALRGTLTSLRAIVGAKVDGNAEATDELADLGISTGAATGGTSTASSLAGTLVIDDAKLTAALNGDPRAVQRLLGGLTGVDGFAQKLEGALAPLTGAGGLLDQRSTAASKEVTDLKARLTAFDERLSRKEEQLRKQFTALEQALSRSQSTQADLAARLGAL